MTDMSAGGLRSRKIDCGISGSQAPRIGCVGADPLDGLEVSQWQRTASDCGHARPTVLGSETLGRAAAQPSRKRKISVTTRLLSE